MNSGLGPAVVRRATLTIDGRSMQNWGGFLETMLHIPGDSVDARLRGNRISTSSVLRGSVLLPGSITELIRVDGPFGGATRRLLNDPRVHFKVCYCSLYDDCWVSDSRGIEPKPTSGCPAGEDFGS